MALSWNSGISSRNFDAAAAHNRMVRLRQVQSASMPAAEIKFEHLRCAGFLFLKGVDAFNKAADRQDKMDGY